MVRRMIVLGSEQTVLQEIALREQPAGEPTDEIFGGLEALGVDFDGEAGVDLKAISRKAARIAEKGVIARVLEQTRWNRKKRLSGCRSATKPCFTK